MRACESCTDITQCAANKHCAFAPESEAPFTRWSDTERRTAQVAYGGIDKRAKEWKDLYLQLSAQHGRLCDQVYEDDGETLKQDALKNELATEQQAVRGLDALYQQALAEVAELKRDAERWREHMEVRRAARTVGGLWVTLRMEPEANGTGKIWQNEFVISTNEMADGVLRNRIIGMKVEAKATELFAAIDRARSEEKPND